MIGTGHTFARAVLLALGVTILVTVSFTYFTTREPAYVMAVRWSASATPEVRAVLRMRHSLRYCEPVGPTSEECAILDRDPKNVSRLVGSPYADDTGHVERSTGLFPDPKLSRRWTWAAHRIPILRRPGVVELIVGLGIVLTIAGLVPAALGLAAPAQPLPVWWPVPVLLAAFFCVPLAVHADLSTRSRFIADDYCSVVSVNKSGGIMRAAVDTYLGWSGRFSAHALDGAVVALGPRRAGFVSAFSVVVFAAALAAWIAIGLARLNGRPDVVSNDGGAFLVSGRVRTLIAVAAGCYGLAALLQMTPDVQESLYWGQGMRTVVPPLILGVVLAAVLTRPMRPGGGGRREWGLATAAFATTMIAAMCGEAYTVAQAGAAGLLAVAVVRRRRPFLPPRVLGALLGSAAGLAIVVASPGNAVRRSFFPPSPGFADLARMTFVNTLEFVRYVLVEQTLATVGLLVLGLALGILIRSDPRFRRRVVRFDVLFLVAAVILLLASFAPAAYGLSQPLPPRTQIIPAFVAAVALVVLAYRIGERIRLSPTVLRPVVLACVAWLAWSSMAYDSRAGDREPAMESYRVYWDEADAMITRAQRSGAAQVRISDPIQNWAGLDDVGPDPSFWVNSCVSDYYGIQVTSPSLD